MNQKVNPEQVVLMLRTGIPAAVISKRLGVSERQVGRIKSSRNIKAGRSLGVLLGTHLEKLLWRDYYNSFDRSFRKVAQRFGVSHELVRQNILEDAA